MKKVLSIRIDEDYILRFDKLSEKASMSRADFIVSLIDGYDDEVVQLLKGQLEEKDKQISQLLEQSRNYQVLLKQEQDRVLLLESPKPVGWFRRLFGSKSEQ